MNKSCGAMRALRCACWWCGSRCFHRICVHRFVVRSGESRTGARVNSGTRNISSRKSFAGLPVKTRINRNPSVAPSEGGFGMGPFSLRHIRNGDRRRRRFSGTARWCAWLLTSRKSSKTGPSGRRSGLGVADAAAEAPFLFQFRNVDNLPVDKNIGSSR